MRITLTSTNKRILLVVLAVVFIALIFFLKTKSTVINRSQENVGLVSGSETIGDLLSKDTDLDGVFDWEESLWSTDPTKPDTDGDGIPDNVEIEKLKLASGSGENAEAEENLTETDRLSRTLFSTMVALNQTGGLDENTIDNLSSTLVSEIENSSPKKVFLLSEVKIINDSSAQAIQNYGTSLYSLLKNYPLISKNGPNDVVYSIYTTFTNISKEYFADGEDAGILSKLDPTIKEIIGMANGMMKMNVPQGLSFIHLDVVNGLTRLAENLNDIKLVDADPILAMGAVNKLVENIDSLETSIIKLTTTIAQGSKY